MHLSITGDYVTGEGCPEPYLRRIADAGFTHMHWCHHWHTDFIYDRSEIGQIKTWLRDCGLALLDLHASSGVEKNYVSARDYERAAGVELLRNRIAMTAELGADVTIVHLHAPPGAEATHDAHWDRVRRSLDELEPAARAYGVRLAVENLFPPNFDLLYRLFDHYGPDYLGLCYDTGHGNLNDPHFDHFERLRDRLISVHLHDNDGTCDQHRLPYTGTVDWDRIARIMAASAYRKCVSLEVSITHSGLADECAFLAAAREAGVRLTRQIAAAAHSANGSR